MELFHGSNVKVLEPEIRANTRALDFGPGFYLTSSYRQAEKWAKSVAKRRRSATAIVNSYVLDENAYEKIKILRFSNADGDWLDFVVGNRKKLFAKIDYDLVIGPVANDSTLPVIDDYMDGRYSEEEAVKRLMPQNLTDQYAFLTKEALSFLKFKGSEEL